MARKRAEKVYLTDEEKKILGGLLEEWNGKPDKKSRDSFVSAEALPKVQQLNLSRFGPDIISRDKAAKILWDSRVQAVYTWFKNNKPYKDRAVFKLERKIPLRRVIGKLKAEELSELFKTMAPDIEKGDKTYPGHFQKALTSLMKDLTDEELEEMEVIRAEWQATGPPIDVRLKAASKYSRKGIINAHQLLLKEMYVSCITFSFNPEPETGVVAVVCHDYVADLHAKSHGKRFKTFKEWNSQGYGRIVQDMIGYANYVDKQRKEEADPESPSEPVNFENGPGGLPLLPAVEVKGVRGMEISKHAQEIIRAYFLRHYQLATGSENARTPWAVIGEEPSKFFDPACLPLGFKFQDPSRMGVAVKTLLHHLRERQADLGVNAFRFTHVLRNNDLVSSQYPPDATISIEDAKMSDTDVGRPEYQDSKAGGMEILPKTPNRTGGKSKKSPKKKSRTAKKVSKAVEFEVSATSLSDGVVAVPSSPTTPTPLGAAPIIPGIFSPHMSDAQVLSSALVQVPQDRGTEMGLHPLAPPPHPLAPPPHHVNTPYPSYELPFHQQYMAFLWHQQNGMGEFRPPVAAGYDVFNPPVGDGYRNWNAPPDMRYPSIDPQLLPAGQPVFSFPASHPPSMDRQDPHLLPDTKVKYEEPGASRLLFPHPPVGTIMKSTPKRKRNESFPQEDHRTPSRSNRKRKPTQRLLESQGMETGQS